MLCFRTCSSIESQDIMAGTESKETKGSNAPERDETPDGPKEDYQELILTGDESSRLRALDAAVRDQNDLERDIGRQADRLLTEQANERDQKRLDRTKNEKLKVEDHILRLHQRLSHPIGTAARVRINAELQNLESKISALELDIEQIQQRIYERQQGIEDTAQAFGAGRLPNETRRDYLIRTGKITPFSKLGGGHRETLTSLQDALIDAEEEKEEELAIKDLGGQQAASHRHLLRPGFDYDELTDSETREIVGPRPQKRRRLINDIPADGSDANLTRSRSRTSRLPALESDDEYIDSGPLAESTEEEWGESSDMSTTRPIKTKPAKSTKSVVEDLHGVDDGNEKVYQTRLHDWVSRRSEARNRARSGHEEDVRDPDQEDSADEWFLPHPKVPDSVLDGGYRIPGDIYPYLFDYQKTGVQWLWELYQQRVGGIIGDEMGLGKTIQVIAFLAGLHYSKKLDAPIIVVCPPTVMKQWVNEFHCWWPPLRVSILHTSGSGMINIKKESRAEDTLTSEIWDPYRPTRMSGGQKAAKRILKRVLEDGHVLVTTYAGLQTYTSLLIPVDWGCAILDEGHKIRNPDTAITIHCKELRTPHRLILSGTPMQNNLTELWSLFDFVFPMRLGTLVNFRNQFEFPIRAGGYANASNLQVQTAAKCAETLKDAISPYLLQRFKIDVAADLPKKTEQVLFCKLTKLQRAAYEAFLSSNEMSAIMRGRRDVLFGVDILRKICNHPDLPEHKTLSQKANYNYGNSAKSGKMQVVKALLELWRDTGHKTLLFAQHRIMLDILEKFIKSLTGFNYRRMDGNTPIKVRQGMVDEFNNDPDIHVFLLTTKVGGLGVNLTGADRVIIYDPDWNPSTDLQARERAWRLGQKREVTIYRLMTAGTIEEKIYHRQIFKQFLTNKILKDPKQRQTFQMSDLHDLFTLGDNGPTETSKMFQEADVTFQENSKHEKDTKESKVEEERKEKDKISKVTGVAALEQYQSATGTPTETDGETKRTAASNSDARLMETIFTRSGVHSALEHEQIFNGRKRSVKADPKIIEAEAKRVAAEAAKELLKAQEVARTVPVGTPTWTGQFGTAGRPVDPTAPGGTMPVYAGGGGSVARRTMHGPSSASIIANLTNRTTGQHSSSGRNSPGRSGTSTPRGKDFMVMIRDYITAQGGAVYTQMLVDHFNRFCDSPRATAEFKEILRTIAVLEKTGRQGRGKWVLKPEYARK
uniref:DNA repair and recombination protein RAD26 n=1 Tax=Coccidioides posadasii RMSCC 3488 TaxID=454284 RepID=A0A0J6FKF0_COCPO|nr:DNA repair and recombination protein RAD26 [Coccidioides posadasii RMSCC 3488]